MGNGAVERRGKYIGKNILEQPTYAAFMMIHVHARMPEGKIPQKIIMTKNVENVRIVEKK